MCRSLRTAVGSVWAVGAASRSASRSTATASSRASCATPTTADASTATTSRGPTSCTSHAYGHTQPHTQKHNTHNHSDLSLQGPRAHHLLTSPFFCMSLRRFRWVRVVPSWPSRPLECLLLLPLCPPLWCPLPRGPSSSRPTPPHSHYHRHTPTHPMYVRHDREERPARLSHGMRKIT